MIYKGYSTPGRVDQRGGYRAARADMEPPKHLNNNITYLTKTPRGRERNGKGRKKRVRGRREEREVARPLN